jgi:hypothetical protein
MISTVVARAILTLERSECVWDKRHTRLSRNGFEPLPLVTGTASKARRKCILMLIVAIRDLAAMVVHPDTSPAQRLRQLSAGTRDEPAASTPLAELELKVRAPGA